MKLQLNYSESPWQNEDGTAGRIKIEEERDKGDETKLCGDGAKGEEYGTSADMEICNICIFQKGKAKEKEGREKQATFDSDDATPF